MRRLRHIRFTRTLQTALTVPPLMTFRANAFDFGAASSLYEIQIQLILGNESYGLSWESIYVK